MLTIILAAALSASACPLTIGVNASGVIYSDRFHGWYRTGTETLRSDLRGGCYNDADPSPVTSVKLLLDTGAPKARVDLIFRILHSEGWDRDRVVVEPWKQTAQPKP
jgi:hypothetical protein